MQNRFPPRTQGADVIDDGVRYRTWAPGKRDVAVVIYDRAEAVVRTVPLHEEPDGYFSGTDERGRDGDLYKYRFEGKEWPDPASRFNPGGVHGPSQVVDPRGYQWRDDSWRCPPLSELVLYELHIGIFTLDGTFRGALEKFDHLADLGVNAIEIMPVADFPGNRNWGYDGVLPYAPARVYGLPNDLRVLVEAAHERGLAVILDVVYNHLGPDGNYLGAYSRDYFNPTQKTPWGDAFRFELKPVRDFFLENPAYWRGEFHIDGFRLDATHAIVDTSEKHFLTEVAERVHSLGGFITVEDERNDPRLLQSTERGGHGLDASWADDFHHVLRVMLTGTRESYYRSYEGTSEELAATLRDGWLLHGQERERRKASSPNECDELLPEQFIFCITNHDQIGNQAFGERLNQSVAPAAFRAASALLCLAPYTPLIFMGQEWATSAPFQFFTDHEPALGQQVTQGRREEFGDFALFRDPTGGETIPDPQSMATFFRSKIRWEETDEEPHAGTLRLYQELLRLRNTLPALRDRRRANWQVSQLEDGVVQIVFGTAGCDQCIVLVDLIGGNDQPSIGDGEWRLLLSTNEERFGSEETSPFALPEVRVLQRIAAD